jgi:hypothetical protein
MAKLTEARLSIKGISGKEYKFDIYSLDTQFVPFGGVYIFTKRYEKKAGKYSHKFIYCGKTNDLSTGFDDHPEADSIKQYNANCICILTSLSEEKRTEIETDILKGNEFVCNEVLSLS